MACRAAVLMYVLQHGMQLDVLLIACAAGALTSRCAAGCVQVLMCVWCSRRHRMAGVAYDVMLLMYELLFDVCNAVLMFVSGAGYSDTLRQDAEPGVCRARSPPAAGGQLTSQHSTGGSPD